MYLSWIEEVSVSIQPDMEELPAGHHATT